ncbi:hypothetical protein B4923_10030 [Brenneria roseae subsp. americana]|uniref:Uncharacterized protein n=1 Tax=Brenneria roseae subsp. americana TaxID=1508507 RepID=A0A2U1TTY3_9GAMM|nr:hypothetical protein B4923_10030 [Brenneria roseae subsp. americana]
MGVALHIVLLPFLNYCIAQLIHTMPTISSAFFCAFCSVPGLVSASFIYFISSMSRRANG